MNQEVMNQKGVMEVSDFEKLVEEAASKIAMELNIEYDHTDLFISAAVAHKFASRLVSEIQKRQEAVRGVCLSYNGWPTLISPFIGLMSGQIPLFRFPPSCEAKVNELEEEIEFLKAVATGNKCLADMYASKLNGR
jgi:hypothetical protein